MPDLTFSQRPAKVMLRRVLYPIFGLVLVSLVGAVWWTAFTRSVGELDQRGRSDLALASDRLVNALISYRQLAVVLASDPRLRDPAEPAEALRSILLRAADVSGALDFVLLDRARAPMASASGATTALWQDAPFVGQALQGTTGRHLLFSPDFERRAFLLAVPIFSDPGPVSRALVVIIDLETLEAEFRGSNPALFMTDASGVIFFANRSELVGRSVDRGGAARSGAPTAALTAALTPAITLSRDREIWTLAEGRALPRRAIHVQQALPVIGVTADALVDLSPAITTATRQAAIAGFALLLLGGAFLAVANQRRVLKSANAVLESRVAARTAALSDTNAALRREIAERIEAETALKQAQADLIQAGKLSALGQMSAGISHELNQPLMAAQSFTENAVTYLERGDAAAATANMTRVAELTRFMGQIIKNFRTFAAQDKEDIRRVDLTEPVRAALRIVEAQLDRHSVTLTAELPPGPVWVQGGTVRLQQVALNLLTNAVDAMVGQDRRHLTVTVIEGAEVTLRISDTGPGLADPDRVFEPFYTTKAPGDGIGLGLSISYGLVRGLGGQIRGHSAETGGATFEVVLQRWGVEHGAAAE